MLCTIYFHNNYRVPKITGSFSISKQTYCILNIQLILFQICLFFVLYVFILENLTFRRIAVFMHRTRIFFYKLNFMFTNIKWYKYNVLKLSPRNKIWIIYDTEVSKYNMNQILVRSLLNTPENSKGFLFCETNSYILIQKTISRM
jgi:hypothetical protein